MAYIGKEPIVGNFQKCDAITVVNGQAAYTLQVSSTNVIPESVNHMIVSLNGVIQAPTTAYTVSGATLTFVSNLATGDVIDFVILLGAVLNVGTVSDDTIATAKIQDDAVTTAKINNDAVTLAKMAAGTDGQIITYDASGNPAAVGPGTDGQVLTSTGAGSPPAFEDLSAGFTAGAVTATTSGSNIDFTSIPSSATIIHLILDNVGTNGDDQLMFQIGDSGGIETSSYIGAWGRFSGTSLTGGTTTDGIDIRKGSPSTYVVSGVISLYLCDPANNAWIMSSQTVVNNTSDGNVQFDQRAVGYKALSGTLTQVRLDTDGSNTFNAGEARIRYIS